jgi:hypothetical protein
LGNQGPILVGVLLLLGCSDVDRGDSGFEPDGKNSGGRGPGGGVTVTPNAADLAGYHMGVDPAGGSREAWLVELTADDMRGSIYVAPQLISICDWSVDSTGAFSFETAIIHEILQYTFSGWATEDGIDGDLRRINPQTGAVDYSRAAAFDRVEPGSGSSSDLDKITGVYSNLSRDEQSGDLVGGELFVFVGELEFRAALTHTEGPPIGPLAATDVLLIGDTLSFKLRAHGWEQKLSVVLVEDGLILGDSSTAGWFDLEQGAFVGRTSPVKGFFEGEKYGTCSTTTEG